MIRHRLHLAGHGAFEATPNLLRDILGDALAFMDGSELCAQADPEVWYPERGGSTAQAKAICARCPLQQPCLDSAVERDDRFGVWGGKTARERRVLIKQRIPQPRQPEAQPAEPQPRQRPRRRGTPTRCLKSPSTRYPTREEAEAALSRHPSTARHFHCTSCCGWHITTRDAA